MSGPVNHLASVQLQNVHDFPSGNKPILSKRTSDNIPQAIANTAYSPHQFQRQIADNFPFG